MKPRRARKPNGPPDEGTRRLLDAYLDIEERENRPAQTRNLKQLATDILRQPAPFAGGLVSILLCTGATLLEPRILGYAIDDAIVPKDWSRLQVITGIYLVVVTCRVIGQVAQGLFFELLGQRVTHGLRARLFGHLQRQPVAIYDRNPAGRLLTRVTNDIESLNEMFSNGFVSILGNVLLVVGILAWMIALSPRLGLLAAAVLPPLIWASVYFSKKLRVAYRDARSRLSALNAFMAENFLGMKVLQLFNRQKLHLERFDRLNQWYSDAQFASTKVFAMFQPSITFASGVAMALVIGYGGRDVLNGELKVGVLVAFFSYVLSLFQPLREIADKWNVFLSGFASAERIFSILEWKPELTAEEAMQSPARLEGVRGRIVFENVWFAYDREHWVLKDFSVDIPAGSRVGIVGHTGAGKTTLISLLMRFYEPQKGRILLDGRDLREYDKRALRAAFGIVQQDVFLFSGSVSDNVTFWDGKPKRALPPELAASFDRPALNERGNNLSMGQRQMLAFARALEADPSMWILDEATANMDSESEGRLSECLADAARGKTSILIAHRLATVRDADRILVLHKGALVEEGKHEELVRREGLYARLYRFQRAQEERERFEAGVAP